MFLVIAEVLGDRPAKINEFHNEEDASDHVHLLKFSYGYQEAFYCVHPGGHPENWRVDGKQCLLVLGSEEAICWIQIRGQRNALLEASDWRGLSDNKMSKEWTKYRQDLRDITNVAHHKDVHWPTEPKI